MLCYYNTKYLVQDILLYMYVETMGHYFTLILTNFVSEIDLYLTEVCVTSFSLNKSLLLPSFSKFSNTSQNCLEGNK